MSRRTNRWIVLVLTLTLPGLTGVATAQADRASAPRDQVVDLAFPGGAAIAYVEALRRAAGDLNVMMSPYLEDVPVQPVELKRVSVEAALRLLEGRYTAGGRSIDVDLDVNPARSPNAMSVYKLEARVRNDPVREDAASDVWSLANALDAGLTPEAVLTAIETALDLYDKTYEPAQLRFHRESGLLIARAHPEQIQTITLILSRLSSPGSSAKAALEAAEQRVTELEDELRGRMDEREGFQVRLMELMTRSEMLEKEIAELRAERRDLRQQLTATKVDRDTTMKHLEAEIAKLRGAGDGRQQP